jgi:4-amino-4-deoxy-L-arabinose transferase-like glycosyltransferase
MTIALFLLGAAVFLFFDQRPTPILLWDESRNIINALEMRETGLGVVTTYGLAPDLWNTKPPLLIWLMYGSVAVFGPSEWALRLPSALAAMATLLMLVLFVRRISCSLATGLAAGVILLLSPGFYSEHGARTADYDAVLLFFTTAYLQLCFLAIHRRKPGIGLSLLIGGLLACALLTKSSAALIPAAGIPVYLVAVKRWRRPFLGIKRYGLMALAALVPFALFCLIREYHAPGYLNAALFNDLFGRFQQSLIGRETSPFFFVQSLLMGWFLVGPFLVLSPFLVSLMRGRKQVLFCYAMTLACVQIGICSFSATRLIHYVLPAFPWLAAAAALGGAALWQRYVASSKPINGRNAVLVTCIFAALCVLTGKSVQWRYYEMTQTQFPPEALYGELFATLADRGYSRVSVRDAGFILEGDHDPNYTPRLDAYRMIWSERGLKVDHSLNVWQPNGDVLATCNPENVPQLLAMGPDIGGLAGCAAIKDTSRLGT